MSRAPRPIPVVVFCLYALTACKLLPVSSEAADSDPDSCVANQDTVRKTKFGLDSETESRITAALMGAVALGETSKKLDDQVASLCESMTRELGSKATSTEGSDPGKRAQIACDAAIEAIRASKQKSEANLSVEMKEQSCGPALEEFALCAKECDPNVASTPGGGVSCEEGKLTGRCDAKCTGTCIDTQADACKATCQGKCVGKCSKGFFGKCGGKCIGTCDMAKVHGKCAGNCDGQCLSDANGTCEGNCDGKCQGACVAELKKAQCKGTCSGSCSSKMSQASCDEVVMPPELNPECSAMCSARTAGKLSCTGGFVEVAVFSAKDKSAADSLRGSVSGRLKEILGVGDGMYPTLEKASESVKAALAGLQQNATDNEELAKKISPCLKLAAQKQEAAGATFAKLHDVGQALYQAVRN